MTDQNNSASCEQAFAHNMAIEEFKNVRSIIELNFKLIDSFENYALAAYAAVFVWAQSPDQNDLKKYSAILLPAIVIVSSLKIYGLIKAIIVATDYQKSLETKYRNINYITFYRSTNTDFSAHYARMLIAIIAFLIGIFINCKNLHY